jgi:hypothetical protein
VNAFAAVSALGVSFLSIMLTALTLWMQRVHNFKSVIPIAHISVSDYENQITVKLKNNGIGPMIIEQFIVSDGQKEKDDIISWMPDLPNGLFWNTFRGNPAGVAIPSNEEMIMIQLLGDPSDRKFSEFRNQVRHALSRLTVRVKYKDIYGRRMPIEERTLTWFGRNL